MFKIEEKENFYLITGKKREGHNSQGQYSEIKHFNQSSQILRVIHAKAPL
jgi:hypothetical protein